MKILNKDEFLLKFNPKIDLLNKEYCRNHHLEILEKNKYNKINLFNHYGSKIFSWRRKLYQI